jgi:hypothetical protein
MAQRGEGQGLQIAVISFAILAIVLAGTAYFFFASAQSAQKELDASKKRAADMQQQNAKAMYRIAAMNYVLGLEGIAKPDVEVAKGAAGGDDPKVKELLDNFEADIALVGDQVAPDGAKSYRTFTTALIAALNKKNATAADSMAQSRVAEAKRDQTIIDEKNRSDTATAAAEKAAAEYKQESETFAAQRNQMEQDKTVFTSTVTNLKSQSGSALQKVNDEKEAVIKQNTRLLASNQALLVELEKLRNQQSGLKEQPDGYILRVDQRLRLVWINVGRADGLLRQTTFAVFDHDENGYSTKKRKARIEVIDVQDHMSEARILEDSPANPIISGDVIETPAWTPGQHIHFALALKMDINKDGVDDYDLVRNVILMNGGVIDAELRPDGTRIGNIDANTRYFVVGQRPDENTSSDTLKKFNTFEQDRQNFSVKKIQVNELLGLMGWKSEERTVELAGQRGGALGQPMPKKAATPAAEGAAPAGNAAPATTDPFGAPAAAAPAAAAPADPFAPAAPAAADPFAPK